MTLQDKAEITRLEAELQRREKDVQTALNAFSDIISMNDTCHPLTPIGDVLRAMKTKAQEAFNEIAGCDTPSAVNATLDDVPPFISEARKRKMLAIWREVNG